MRHVSKDTSSKSILCPNISKVGTTYYRSVGRRSNNTSCGLVYTLTIDSDIGIVNTLRNLHVFAQRGAGYTSTTAPARDSHVRPHLTTCDSTSFGDTPYNSSYGCKTIDMPRSNNYILNGSLGAKCSEESYGHMSFISLND